MGEELRCTKWTRGDPHAEKSDNFILEIERGDDANMQRAFRAERTAQPGRGIAEQREDLANHCEANEEMLRREKSLHKGLFSTENAFASKREGPTGTMTTSRKHDVAVIGAGVFGAWTALQLARRGKSVVLVEAYGPGHSRSSSGDESRIIRMGYGKDEIYTRWSQHSLVQWKELFAATRNEALFQQ